ncbi:MULTISPECIES: beta-galactosidase [unclassified Streptomyces]|uniref:beta-galactosidase n=1 Tax=unclassified Streptomyces TaxID=2593676 RepID=UPI0036E20DAB
MTGRSQPQPQHPRMPWKPGGFAYGGDYNPEQWSEEVRREDVTLMREAGVTLVTVGVFAWGALEPQEDVFDFGWLDDLLERLHEAGIGVDLATPTAAPPSWLLRRHPEILPVRADGTRLAPGGRLGWCPSNPDWRRHSLRVVRALGERYGAHPAVRMWHVGNEYGNGNRLCHCEHSARHFRTWLAERHGSLAALNHAWGTAFWSHQYQEWDEIQPPGDAGMSANPGLVLDFARFSSDALLDQYAAERAVLRELSPDRAATTNFMVGAGPHVVDHTRWARAVDLVSTDHYTIAADPDREQELAFSADRTRGLASGRPWLLMEHAASAVSWQPRNLAKDPGDLALHSLAHIARGADGALFFQWRQSAAGAEQYHSAMLPHAGTHSRVWKEVTQLGATLRALAPVAGSTVEPARVALLVDDEAAWAWNATARPHQDLDITEIPRRYHAALWRRAVLADVVPPTADLTSYAAVVVPALYLTHDDFTERLEQYVHGGGHALVTHLSGIVDPTNRVRLGGYPGAFRDLLGVYVEEFRPLLDDTRDTLDNGWSYTAWSEHVHTTAATAVAAYTTGPLAGLPAVTRRAHGRGEAWYVSAHLDPDAVDALLRAFLPEDVRPTAQVPEGVEAVRRTGPDGSHLFLLNHNHHPVTLTAHGHDLTTGLPRTGPFDLPARGFTVVREDAPKDATASEHTATSKRTAV